MADYQENTSTNLTNCGYQSFDNPHTIKIIGIVHCFFAAVSFVVCLLVIGLFLLFKKYKFFQQRLILYLSLTALLYSLTAALVNLPNFTKATEDYCKWIGFISQYAQWSLLLAVAIITFDITLRVIIKCSTRRLEIIYILFIAIFPATFNWIPLLSVYNLYGPSGIWCWIRVSTLNNTGHCVINETGFIFQFSLWYTPLLIIMSLISLTYITIIVILRKKRRQLNRNNIEEIGTIQRQVNQGLVFVAYTIIFMTVYLIPLAHRVIEYMHKPIMSLWYVDAIITPLLGGFTAIVFALDPKTRKTLNWRNIRGAIHNLCSRQTFNEYRVSFHEGSSRDSTPDRTSHPLLSGETHNC